MNFAASKCQLSVIGTSPGTHFSHPRACLCLGERATLNVCSILKHYKHTHLNTALDGILSMFPRPRPVHGLDEAVYPSSLHFDAIFKTNEDANADHHETSASPASSRQGIARMSLIGTIPYEASRNASWLHDTERVQCSREECRVTSKESVTLSDALHMTRTRRGSRGRFARHSGTLPKPNSQPSLSGSHTGKRHMQNLKKRERDYDPQDVEPRPSRRKRTNRLGFDDGDDGLTLTEQISSAGETAAIAAHVEDFETMGRGAGKRMPSADILGLMRESLGNTRADAPGLPGSGHSAFALCGVAAQVEKVLIEDANNPEDTWYGAECLSLDSEDSEIFVSEGDIELRDQENISSDATTAEKPESVLLAWPGWFDDDVVEEKPQRD